MAEEDLHHEYEIALELIKDGGYQEALPLLNKIAAERPDSKHVMYARGVCVAALGRIEEACAIRDQLSGHHGSVARQLTKKLDEKIQEKLQERERDARGVQRRAPSEQTDEPGPRPSRSLFPMFVVLILAGAGAVVIAVFIANERHHRQSARGVTSVQQAGSLPQPALGSGPDAYLESVTFFPSDSERPFRYAVFMSQPQGEVSNITSDAKDDCVGSLIVPDWPTLKAKAKKALVMSNSSAEELAGTPRNKLVCTVMLPVTGTPLSGQLEGRSLETFNPGAVKDLQAIMASCGSPEHTEMWTQRAKCLALDGKTYWWGRIGLAADADGAITHVLLRAYPGDKR
jgi:hypothetical protein